MLQTRTKFIGRAASLAAIVLSAALMTPSCAQGQEEEKSPPPVPVEQRGPRIGEPIPEFTLRDQFDREQSPQSLMGPKGFVLLFVRSADW
jgi:hypothetical protein